jgi:hypothetical protein
VELAVVSRDGGITQHHITAFAPANQDLFFLQLDDRAAMHCN